MQQNDAILDINLEVNPWRHHDVKGQARPRVWFCGLVPGARFGVAEVLEGIKEQCKANRAAAEVPGWVQILEGEVKPTAQPYLFGSVEMAYKSSTIRRASMSVKRLSQAKLPQN